MVSGGMTILGGMSTMSHRSQQNVRNRTPAKFNAKVLARRARRAGGAGKRARGGGGRQRLSYMPPERWYEPQDEAVPGFRVVQQSPGIGYRHVVTAEEVRERLSQLPQWMTAPLDVVQLSRMTRKKRTFPCYGMQWGSTIYLYPVEEDRIEHFTTPPKPGQIIEARMYGATWEQGDGDWRLMWSEESLKDFYLNNILIHELGHILDQRNTSYADRERYAEWFALEYGYKRSRRAINQALAQAAADAFCPQ
jgi:hypothetical protein